ncbi:type VII secretion-associated serine protease mycosin [Streptomyces galbus]|uniref:Type VII secretion-associated serine protease mycosin n=1 Tax=Streptomyces galbus TaxID=33898 RepID=A0A4U5W8W2_STRGB|nr:type VII secretion-associated serine protease mycosin [Streptomyces galbus]TKS98044.1 type VII secretion-associated serine protease mycosin [Streptomyces galbus]GHD43458.1 type VII secretion-associated serine protease [Streptomyces galbus]
MRTTHASVSARKARKARKASKASKARQRDGAATPRPPLTSPVKALAAATSLVLLTLLPAAPAGAADGTQCTFPAKPYTGRPWALQRVNLDALWARSTGRNVRVAVIDTGVDVRNPQLAGAVDASKGANFLPPPKNARGETIERADARGTTDPVGHGTRVAGIIAARPARGTGFVGLAPGATIIPIAQNNAEGNGTALTLAEAITYAVTAGADVINISQDTADAVEPDARLEQAVHHALAQQVVVVASAGNDGLGGNAKPTYPASYEGVLAVASSDRNNERAPFSQSGDFVDVAAPGVDMVSTVPGGGHCSDNGTSFSAPYVAAVAALLRSAYPSWTAQEIVAQIEQTAERSIPGHDRLVGWGVVDPVKALTATDPTHPIDSPHPQEGPPPPEPPTISPLHLGESPEQRTTRLATYVVIGGAAGAAALGGAAVAVRDGRRRRGVGR